MERLSGINKFCREQGALVGHQQEQCGSLGEDVSSGTPDGIEKSRSTTRKPLDQRWKPEGLATITARASLLEPALEAADILNIDHILRQQVV